MRKALLLLVVLGSPVAAQAQETVPFAVESVFSSGQFFVALVAGLVLAIAFQMVLTNLSVAAGINAVGPVDRQEHQQSDQQRSRGSATDRAGRTARKISSAFGAWAMITASLALFFSSWIAVQMILTPSNMIGALMGLVVWGVFTITMMALEATAISSMAGALFRAASSGMRSIYQSTRSMFSSSQEEQAAETARRVTQEVRNELFGGIDTRRIERDIEHYISEMQRSSQEMPGRIRQELAQLLDESEIRAVTEHEAPIIDQETIVAELKTKHGTEQARAMAGKVQEAVNQLRQEGRSGKSRAEQAADTSLGMSGMSREEAEQTRQKWENYLRNTNKQALDPEGIKRDIEELFHDPWRGAEALSQRFSQIDRSTVVELLAQRQDMNRQEAEQTADRVWKAIDEVRTRMTGDHHHEHHPAGGDGHHAATMASVQERVRSKIRSYLNSLGEPQLRYSKIERDVQRLFHDPKAGAKDLQQRLKSIDRDTIKAIVESQPGISGEKAEQIVSRIESARDQVMSKAQQMEKEVERRLQHTKEEAYHQAEEARKTAATAAWWAVATLLVSGGAAVLGGLAGAL